MHCGKPPLRDYNKLGKSEFQMYLIQWVAIAGIDIIVNKQIENKYI